MDNTDEKALLVESLEFAINVGCPNNCKKYCPQEIVLQKYKGDKTLTYSDFKTLLQTVPTNVQIIFAGVSEPFLNKDFIKMLKHANNIGFKTSVFTTLVGAKPEQILEICDIDFVRFVLHMPDPNVLKLKFDPIRAECEHLVWSNIPITSAMSMNAWLTHPNGREQISRGIKGNPKKVGYCIKLHEPQLFTYPNGDTYLCCTDWALEHKIGNLFEQPYSQLRTNLFKNQPYDLCRYCPSNLSMLKYRSRKLAVGTKQFLQRCHLI